MKAVRAAARKDSMFQSFDDHGGPEAGAALLAERSAEEIVKLTQELPSDDAAAIIDYLPEDLSSAVLELIQKRPAGGRYSLWCSSAWGTMKLVSFCRASSARSAMRRAAPASGPP